MLNGVPFSPNRLQWNSNNADILAGFGINEIKFEFEVLTCPVTSRVWNRQYELLS